MMVEMLDATHGSVIIHDQKYHQWREITAHTAQGVAPLFGDQWLIWGGLAYFFAIAVRHA